MEFESLLGRYLGMTDWRYGSPFIDGLSKWKLLINIVLTLPLFQQIIRHIISVTTTNWTRLSSHHSGHHFFRTFSYHGTAPIIIMVFVQREKLLWRKMSNIHSSYLCRFLMAVAAVNILIHVWLSFSHKMRANIAGMLVVVLISTRSTQGIYILVGVRWDWNERLIQSLLHLMIQVRLELDLSQGCLDSCRSALGLSWWTTRFNWL